jgi:hypothetical protein
MATQLISKLRTMSKPRGYVPASNAAALAQVTGREVRVYCPRNTTEMLYAASQTCMQPQRPSAHAPVMISWVPRGWPGFTYDDETGQISTTIQSNNHFVPIAIGPGFDIQLLGSIQHTGQVPHTHVPPATPPHMPIQYDMLQHAQQPAAAPAAATAQDSTTRRASTAPRPTKPADQALRRAAIQHLHVQQTSAPATSLTKPPVHTN